MKTRMLFLHAYVAIAAALLVPLLRAETKIATQFDLSSETTPAARKFYFETIPGHRYGLWQSINLLDWEVVSGFPKVADGMALEHTFAQLDKKFFQIEPIDEQAPVIVDQFPGVDAYAVRRFEDLRFQLSDATGIDPASIRLTLGNGATLSLGASGLNFANNILSYDTGDAAIGAYGATVPATLIVADTLGHSLTHTFSFTLEVLPKVVPNLYVFGSPAAQRAGQKIPATPTAALAKQNGPIRASDADPWEISSVLADRVVITYTGATAPAFAANTYLANLTPVKLSDIFYRQILSVNDAPGTKQLTLMTTDVPFAEIVEEGTATISADSVVYDLGADGTIQQAVEIGFSKTFPRIGIDLDNEGPLTLPGNPKYGVSLYEANAWITPSLEFAVETKGFSVQRAAIQARADIEGTLIPEISYLPAGTEKEKEWNVHPPMKKLVLVGFISAVPVWMDYTYTTKVKLDAEANIGALLRFGWSRNASLSAGASYVKDASPRVSWSRNATVSPLTVEPVSLSLGGTVQAKVSLVPQLDVRLESLLGFYVNADPRAEFEITADGGIYVSGQDGKIQMSPGGNATLTGGFFADLNAGLSIIGVDQSYLPAMDPFRIYTNGWELEFPEPEALAFTVPLAPQAVSVALGGNLNIEGTASGGDGAIFYQWLHNGILIPGQTSRQLVIPNVTSGNAGTYTLRARIGTGIVFSPVFTVTTYKAGLLGPGSIAFVGFNCDYNDDLSFVVLTDIAPSTVIYFTDNEWNGAEFNNSESCFSWTATNKVVRGTVVAINELSRIPSGLATVSTGTIAKAYGTNFGLSSSNEAIFAFQGSGSFDSIGRPLPGSFLAAIGTETVANAGNTLVGTGLAEGQTALFIPGGEDIGVYVGSRGGESIFSSFLPLINDVSNWITQGGSGNQSMDGIQPDIPFNFDPFVTNP
jgi:hypothetical protein